MNMVYQNLLFCVEYSNPADASLFVSSSMSMLSDLHSSANVGYLSLSRVLTVLRRMKGSCGNVIVLWNSCGL